MLSNQNNIVSVLSQEYRKLKRKETASSPTLSFTSIWLGKLLLSCVTFHPWCHPLQNKTAGRLTGFSRQLFVSDSETLQK